MNDRSDRVHLWVLQKEIHHYRLPVWDEFVARHGDRFDLTVLGGLKDGLPYGGSESRTYIHELSTRDENGRLRDAWREIPARLAEHRPDVCISELNPRYPMCWRLPGLCRRRGIALVGWSKVYGAASSLRLPVQRWLKATLMRRYPVLMVYGRASLEELRRYGIDPQRVVVTHNTIDTRRIFHDPQPIYDRANALRHEHGLEDKRIALIIARMQQDKRQGDVLEAWPQLREIDDDLVLVLVGGGEELEAIRRRAAELDAGRILVTGRVPEGDDYAWIAAADYNLQPGAVGLAINQSMALATPTIIADEPGPDAEMVVHGETGWRYRRGDREDLVRVMREVQHNPERTRRVAEAAREHIRSTVNIEQMVERIAESAEKALQLKPR